MHSAAATRSSDLSAARRVAIWVNLALAAALALLAADSLVTIVDRFRPWEPVPRGAAFLWRLQSYVPASLQFAATAALFVAAAAGFRRRAWWRWWAQCAALALLLFPFGVRFYLN